MFDEGRPDLDAIERRCSQATPGPWRSDSHIEAWWGGERPAVAVWYTAEYGSDGLGTSWKPACHVMPDRGLSGAGSLRPLEDAAFIAAARQDLPALLVYARRLEGEAAAMRVALQGAQSVIYSLLERAQPGTEWWGEAEVKAALALDAGRPLLERLRKLETEVASAGGGPVNPHPPGSYRNPLRLGVCSECGAPCGGHTTRCEAHPVPFTAVTLDTAGVPPRFLALAVAGWHDRGKTVEFAPPLGDELYGLVMAAASALMALPREGGA